MIRSARQTELLGQIWACSWQADDSEKQKGHPSPGQGLGMQARQAKETVGRAAPLPGRMKRPEWAGHLLLGLLPEEEPPRGGGGAIKAEWGPDSADPSMFHGGDAQHCTPTYWELCIA